MGAQKLLVEFLNVSEYIDAQESAQFPGHPFNIRAVQEGLLRQAFLNAVIKRAFAIQANAKTTVFHTEIPGGSAAVVVDPTGQSKNPSRQAGLVMVGKSQKGRNPPRLLAELDQVSFASHSKGKQNLFHGWSSLTVETGEGRAAIVIKFGLF